MNSALRGLGLLVVAYGVLLAVLASGGLPAWSDTLLRGRRYNFGVPALTVCAGVLLGLGAQQPGPALLQHLHRAARWILLALPALLLGTHLAQSLLPTDPADPWTHGLDRVEMAPNAALAFLAVGVAFQAVHRLAERLRWVFVGAALVATVLALTSLVGHLLRLESLYSVAGHFTMRLPTAASLTLICCGLWLLLDAVEPFQRPGVHADRGRITRRSLMVLALVAVGAGVAGFSLLQGTLERAMADGLLRTARTNAKAIEDGLQQKLWFPRVITTRPTVMRLLADLERAPPSPEQTALLHDLMRSFQTADIHAVRFLGPQGQVHGEVGHFDGDRSEARDALQVPDLQAELRWSQGYLLRVDAEVVVDGRRVGSVQTEQRLTALDEFLRILRSGSDSADALICSRQQALARCAPTRFYAQPFSIPMHREDGSPNMPINRALLGESGVASTLDLRGLRVLASYVPVGSTGLALVVKEDLATLYAPLRKRLVALIPMMGLAIALGAWALHLRVRPVLQQALQDQERNRLLLQNAHEAFVSLDSQGRVRDWNRAAEVLFGVAAAQAAGQPVQACIQWVAPGPTGPAALEEGVRELLVVGAGGVQRTVEVSVKAMPGEGGVERFLFFRDLTDRRRAEARLRDSEHSLRTITNNVPALISRVSAEGIVLFANAHCSRVYGLPLEQIVGRSVRELRGEAVFAQIQPFMQRVLRGEAVMFETQSDIHGKRHHFQQSYVPDISPDGQVHAFYAVSVDISDLKGNEERLAESEKRLRDITDHLPVLISYIDPQHRVRFINATCRDWLGIEPTVALGRTLKELDHGRIGDSDRLTQALTGQRVSFESNLDQEDGSRFLTTDFVPDIDASGAVSGVYALSADVTRLKAVESELSEMLDSDTLTGQANRRALTRKLPEALARCKRSRSGLAVLFLDLDRFKSINDQHGHAVGDAVLVEFAQRLVRCVRATDTVVRWAGDEFVLLLEGLRDAQEAAKVADKVLALVAEPLAVPEGPAHMSTSIGIAYCEPHVRAADADDLLNRADLGLYAAKRAGRGCYRFGEAGPGDAAA